jgi:hypothetical protein
MWSIGFLESYDANRFPLGWAEPGFDDAGWDAVQILTAGGGPPEAPFGGMRIEPFPTLLPRAIPFLSEAPVAPRRVLGVYGVDPRPELDLADRLYAEELVAPAAGLVEQPAALLTPDGDATVVRTTAGCDATLVVDFGRIYSTYPFIELTRTAAR